MFARACVTGPVRKQPAASAAHEQVCLDQYNECMAGCPVEAATDPTHPCAQNCYAQWDLCLQTEPIDSPSETSCEPSDDDSYDDEPIDWSCETEEDPYYDDSASDWSCGDSNDYEDNGLDCNADSGEGDGDSEDWGEDWGERSPAGGDGIESPADLPG